MAILRLNFGTIAWYGICGTADLSFADRAMHARVLKVILNMALFIILPPFSGEGRARASISIFRGIYMRIPGLMCLLLQVLVDFSLKKRVAGTKLLGLEVHFVWSELPISKLYPVLTTSDAHKWGMTVLVENERMAGTQQLGAHIVIVLWNGTLVKVGSLTNGKCL